MKYNLKKMVGLLSIIVFLSIFSGCGKNEGQEKETLVEKESLEHIDVLNIDWKMADEVAEGSWMVTGYYENMFATESDEMIRQKVFSCNNEEELFVLQCLSRWVGENEEEYTYQLTTINTGTMEWQMHLLEPKEWENISTFSEEQIKSLSDNLKKGYSRVAALDVYDSVLCIFIANYTEEWELANYYCMQVDKEGKLINVNDLIEAYKTINPNNKIFIELSTCMINSASQYTIMDNQSMKIAVCNDKGELLSTYDFNDWNGQMLNYTGKDYMGNPVFYIQSDDKGVQFFSVNEKEKSILYEDQMIFERAYMDAFGNMYLHLGGKIVKWNPENGSCENINDLRGAFITDYAGITRNSEGDIVVLLSGLGETCVFKLSKDSEVESREITVLIPFHDNYIEWSAADYMRKHPGIKIVIQEMNPQDATEMNRIVEQVKKGEGPDLIYTDRSQIDTLCKAKLLTPLNDLIDGEAKSQIFQGVLSFGEYDDGLYAIPLEAYVSTLLISKDYWNEKGWTLEEAVNTYDKWKNDKDEKRFMSIYFSLHARQLLWNLCLQNIDDSTFIDFENGISYFDQASFCKLLVFCKENGEVFNSNTNYDQQEMYEQVIEGRALTLAISGNFLNYSRDRAMFGEDYHVVGYPSENRNYGTIQCYRGMGIFEGSDNKDVAVDFFNYLLSEENQVKNTTGWIRKDVFLNHVKDGNSEEEPYFTHKVGRTVLAGKPDGTSYLDEYMELMEYGQPMSKKFDIQNIIMEEASYYFDGEKNVEEVAKIIQNRIELYLAEKN